MSAYELGILGGATDQEFDTLTETLGQMVGDFGIELGTDLVVRQSSDVLQRDRRAAFAATYFGAAMGHVDEIPAASLIAASLPIIPTLGRNEDFSSRIPSFLHAFNASRRRADDPKMTALAASLLECIGLLRRQRRIFVSYRRIESREVAIQLHDRLTERGFDVFLDTHDIRPGERFQDSLWNRLCDSDVMLVLETKTYFSSTWTRQELGRAQAKGIRLLRLVWPGHTPGRTLSASVTVALDTSDFSAPDGCLSEVMISKVVVEAERLRSKSISSRYMAITGLLRAELDKIDAVIEGVGSHRAIAIRLADSRRVWAYPIVGVPTAELLHDIADKASYSDQTDTPLLVYDHVGISPAWAGHLAWLDEHIKAVRAVKAHEAGWVLGGL